MNRTYLQKYLKTNSSIQWLYMKYMQYYAKKFLNHPETWKQWQLAKLTAMLSYAQRHCTYYRKYIVGEVRVFLCWIRILFVIRRKMFIVMK